MEYNIGQMVVRRLNDQNHWDMVGIVLSKRLIGTRTYYNIQWADPRLDTCSNKWQAHEFVLIETAKKLEKNT